MEGVIRMKEISEMHYFLLNDAYAVATFLMNYYCD